VTRKKKKISNLRNASPAKVAKAFAGELVLLSGDAATKFDGDVVSTDLRSLDEALGIGGMPRGRIVEVFGPESSAKTSIALHMVGRVQAEGGKAAYIDAEHALNLKYAKDLNVDVDNLLISQPDSGERALEIMHTLLKSRAVDVIVIDSVASLVPLREQEKGVEGSTMGMQAAMMSKSLRIMNPRIKKSNTLVIFINQTRSKIGVMFGNPETTSGGTALKFYSSMRLSFRFRGQYKKKGKVRGMDCRVRVVKNKMAIPYMIANLRLIYGKGWRSIKDSKRSKDDDES
jgi:recombination protein RecA